MRAVVQRVTRAQVGVAGEIVGQIDRGLLVLLGVAQADTDADAAFMGMKLQALRVFADDAGKMNLSVAQVGGAILMVSQFTLLGSAHAGNRPAFGAAMEPVEAERLYEKACRWAGSTGVRVARGVFGADMQVSLVNDGPVTILIDSTKLF